MIKKWILFTATTSIIIQFNSSYRPISLLSIINKLFEKLILRRLNMDLKPDEWMPPHQFGFRNQHSTIQQTHRIIHKINQALEDKQYCMPIFLDVSQAFHKVWHDVLLFKIKKVFNEKGIKHHDKLGHHSNTLLQPLLEQQQRRRLKKIWPVDLLDGWGGFLTGGALITTK
jgi:hypothetical protein